MISSFSQRMASDGSSRSSTSAFVGELGTTETVDVVPSHVQDSCDRAPSMDAVSLHTLPFPLTSTSSSEGELMFSVDTGLPFAMPEEMSYLTTMQTTYQSALPTLAEEIGSDDDASLYDELGSSFESIYGKNAIRSVDTTLPNLRELKETDVFANRYRIEPGAPSRIWRRYAIDTYTRRKVVLRFYPNAERLFKTVTAMHKHLAQENCICRLLDTIVDVPGFPPCHVLERGDCSLTEILRRSRLSMREKRTILHHILGAVKRLHDMDVVHGDLTPEKIQWFSAELRWKLADLDTCRWIEVGNLQASSLEFAAPEVVQATESQTPLLPQPSADMWSIGVIAHELLTGEPFYGPMPSAQHVANVLKLQDPLPEVQAESQGERDFLRNLLSSDPETRPEAEDAIKSCIFSIAELLPRRKVEIKKLSKKMMKMEHAHEDNLLRAMAARLRVSIHIERFRKRSKPSDPFQSRDGTEVLSTVDSGLPNESIHVLRLEESHRLRIRIEDEPNVPLAIDDIETVTVNLPDAPPVDLLTVVTQHDAKGQEIVALIDPRECASPTLHRVSPSSGGVQNQYAKLEVHIRVRHVDNASWTFDLKRPVYCKMVRQHSYLLYQKLLCKARERWQLAPQWMKRCTRLLTSVADSGSNLCPDMRFPCKKPCR